METISPKTKNENNTIDAKELLDWCLANPKLSVHKIKTPIDDYELNDVRIKNRMKEDETFLHDKEIFSRIRRGNCIATYKIDGVEQYSIARKGLVKFFDFLKKYKGNKQKERKFVMEPVEKVFLNNKHLTVYITEKANGENAQISYEPAKNAWIIASKNVTIACRDESDAEWYLTNSENPQKFSYCVEFANLWFDILENKIIKNNLYENFINDITGYTLVCENVGFEHQHIKLYTENDLVFYSMIKNNSKLISEPVEKSFEIFRKYNLSAVNMMKSELLTTKEDFYEYMIKVYDNVLKQDVLVGGEGSVAYFTQTDGNNETIVSMGKLKTFEYRFLRKLREKIKMLKSNNKSVSEIIDKIEKECKEILGEDGDELDLTHWLSYAKFVLNLISMVGFKCDFETKYASFTLEMKELFKNGNLNLDTDTAENICLKYKTISKESEIIEINTNTDMQIDDEVLYDGDGGNSNQINYTSNDEFVQNYLENLEQNCKNLFKKGGVYFFLNYGLPGGGKSTFYSILEQVIQSEYSDMINLLYTSSDKMKEIMVQNYLEKNPHVSHVEAFEKVSKNQKQYFNREIIENLNNFRCDDKINIYFVDKNFPGKMYETFFSDMKEYDKKLGYEMYIFKPYIRKPINYKDCRYPFSLNYLIQCYYRIKGRKHETLDFEINPNAHHILIAFLQNFKGNALYPNSNKIFSFPISLSDEKMINIPLHLIEKFCHLMEKVGHKGFDSNHMQTNCKELIDTFFSTAEKYMPRSIFDDTRERIRTEIRDFLYVKLYGRLQNDK